MKIGLIGNMNNLSFAIARHLKDYGYDTEVLIYNDDPKHFYPDQDTYTDNYKSFTRQINWGDPGGFLKLSKQDIHKDTDQFDFVMGCGIIPAAMEKIGRRLDLFTPYGYDLYSLPFYKIVHPLRIPSYFKVAQMQRRGILNTPCMIFDKTNKDFEKLIYSLKYKGRRIISTIPMLYNSEYNEKKILEHLHLHPQIIELKKIREQNEIVFLQHIRQVWKKQRNKWALKANDLLLKGYAVFLQRNKKVSSKLILFEYGTDVMETKKLAAELKIEKHIFWLQKMPRKFVMITLYFADLIIGEMENSWLTYGAVCEALCMGKPFMHKRIDEEFKNDYDYLYPMIYADSVETVVKGLEGAIFKKKDYLQMGIEGRNWFNRYFIDEPLKNIIEIVKDRSGI